MKKPIHVGVLLGACLMSACGQPGPLYLPGTKPPFYVPPEPESETKEEAEKAKASEQDKTNSTDQEQSSEPQPVPQNKEPAKEQ